VDYILSHMSLRTQEAARAARLGREPNFDTVGIKAEDVEYAIMGRNVEKFNAAFIPFSVVDLIIGTDTVSILVKCADGDVYTREMRADADLIEWLRPVYRAALKTIAENESAKNQAAIAQAKATIEAAQAQQAQASAE
jgi:hypothetical protein